MTKIRDTTEPLPVTQIVTKAKEIGKVTKEQQKTNDQFGFFCLFVCFLAQPQFIDYTQTFFWSFQICQGPTPRMVFVWQSQDFANSRAYLLQRHGGGSPNQNLSWRSLTRTAWQCFRLQSTPSQSSLVMKTWRTTEVHVFTEASLFSDDYPRF